MKRKNSTYNLSEDTYQSIEFMPIWNWNKIMETRDLKYLFFISKVHVNNSEKYTSLYDYIKVREDKYSKFRMFFFRRKVKRLKDLRLYLLNTSELWDTLQDEYIKIFGLDAKFVKRLKLLKEKARLNYEFVETKNRFLNTLLSIVDADLKELETGVAIEFNELKDHLEKHKGYRIDPKTTTVIEWQYALKNMTNG